MYQTNKKMMLQCDLGFVHLALTMMPLNHAYGRKCWVTDAQAWSHRHHVGSSHTWLQSGEHYGNGEEQHWWSQGSIGLTACCWVQLLSQCPHVTSTDQLTMAFFQETILHTMHRNVMFMYVGLPHEQKFSCWLGQRKIEFEPLIMIKVKITCVML